MTVNNILTTEYNQMTHAEKKAYIEKNGDLKVLATYIIEGWDDIQLTAHSLGCTVSRGWDNDLNAAHKFSEFYIFKLKARQGK